MFMLHFKADSLEFGVTTMALGVSGRWRATEGEGKKLRLKTEIVMLSQPPECIYYYFNSWYGISEVFSKIYQV